jgi:hypothetical protein
MSRRFIDVSRPALPFLSRVFLFIGIIALLAVGMVTLGHAECSISVMRALAQEHSNYMARWNALTHNGFESRARRGARAENVAYGYGTEAATLAQWRRSPPHAANMRLPGCRGVASAVAKSGRRYWTMEIGQ